MTDLRTAAQQALEALECPGKARTADEQDAITALRAALAEPDTDPVDEYRKGFIAGQIDMRDRPEEQPEPVQEPVGEVYRYGKDSHGREWHGIHWYDANVDTPNGTKLYTAPPQRKPLTEEEIHDCFQQRHRDKAVERRMITRAIERAHGIGGTDE